ncbi:MAG: DUF1257 domain-containing protein [Chloroflexi bacterium]|nr:DUF1257 domain-containing protein [Chloroflexota bacterium]
MSHFTKIKTRIRDSELLVRCLEQMGFEVQKGRSKVRGFSGAQDVELKIKIQGNREIGFVKNNQDYYDMVADWYGVTGTSSRMFSKDLEDRFREMENSIRRSYARETVLEKLESKGFTVVEQKETGKTVKILARRWA